MPSLTVENYAKAIYQLANVADGGAVVTGGCGGGAVQPASRIAAAPRAKIRLPIRQMIWVPRRGCLWNRAQMFRLVELRAKQNPALMALSQ